MLHYRGTRFHRVVPGFLCQAGDVTGDPYGRSGRSIYGWTFDDEGFRVRHKGAGDLLMATAGIANNNHSQFAVAMAHLTEFETKHCIFGVVLDGMDILRVMELEGAGDGVTKRPIVITACGECDADGRPLDAPGSGGEKGGEAAALPIETLSADEAAAAVGGVTLDDDAEGDDGPTLEEGPADDEDGPTLESQ